MIPTFMKMTESPMILIVNKCWDCNFWFVISFQFREVRELRRDATLYDIAHNTFAIFVVCMRCLHLVILMVSIISTTLETNLLFPDQFISLGLLYWIIYRVGLQWNCDISFTQVMNIDGQIINWRTIEKVLYCHDVE